MSAATREFFRIFKSSVRPGRQRTSSSVSVCLQARYMRVLESRLGAVCIRNGANSLSTTRRLHTGRHCLSEPALNDSVPLSPAVRYLVYTHNISDLSQITGTGPGHRLLKGDILQYIQDTGSGSQTVSVKAVKTVPKKESKRLPMHKLPQGSFTDVPVDSWRAAAAQRVAQHKATTPHTYTTASCTLDRVFELGYRDHHLTAFLVKAAALTVQRVPLSNCVWADGTSQPLSTVSVSVLGGGGGSVRVDRATVNTLESIARAVKEGTTSETTNNSSISVYHLEGVNISHFTTAMDPTSSSTLCVGSSHLVLNHQGALSRQATLTLTADARVMDIELCCHWLETFCSIVETPDTSGLL